MSWTGILDRAGRAGLLPDPELDDPDDPSVVELGGPCWICGTVVDGDGTCEQGHDDLDRAEAGAALVAAAG